MKYVWLSLFLVTLAIAGCFWGACIKSIDSWSIYKSGFEMNRKCANTIEIPDYGLAQPDEIEAVERAWKESIPDHLIQIGGIDWKGWASICKNEEDPSGIFFGEYRDAALFYKGIFRYSHPEKTPVPNEIFSDYYMSHYEGGRGILFREIKHPQSDYFYMEIVNPEAIRHAMDQAHVGRESGAHPAFRVSITPP